MLNILQSIRMFAAAMLVLATLVAIASEIVSRLFRRRFRVFTPEPHRLFKQERRSPRRILSKPGNTDWG